MATISKDSGIVTVIMNGTERNLLQVLLNNAKNENHQDFGDWLIDLQAHMPTFIGPVGGGDFELAVNEDDAKGLQDLMGQFRDEFNVNWNVLLEDFDNKLHNLWLRPADHFPRP